MSSILKIPFNKIRKDEDYQEILLALERGFRKFNIDYYLVGATARDVWMRGLHEVPPRRATLDIDFAVMVKDNNIFAMLNDYLTTVEGFSPIQGNAFRLFGKNKKQVDLIPFGELEREGIATIEGTGITNMNVEGFMEVYEKATEIIYTEDQQFKVCTLPGIVILKLIAWNDKPEIRSDDIADIAEIIKHYFYFNSDAIWDLHSDLFTDENDLDEIASQYLGREIWNIIYENPKLTEKLKRILEAGLTDIESNKLDELLGRNLEKSIEFARSLILHILAGIKEKKC